MVHVANGSSSSSRATALVALELTGCPVLMMERPFLGEPSHF